MDLVVKKFKTNYVKIYKTLRKNNNSNKNQKLESRLFQAFEKNKKYFKKILTRTKRGGTIIFVI